MAFNTPDFQAIRDAILRDIANQRPSANVALDGDYAIRANAHGAAVEGLYQHQQWIARQIFPDTSDADSLEHHASLRGLSRNRATLASGTILFGGTAGSAVPAGSEVKTNGAVSFVTTAAGVIGGGGTATIAAQAVTAGAAGNQAAGTALTLTSAPAGVHSSAEIVAMTGGTDDESNTALLARLLFLLRNPPCGGAAHDYYTWAMDVDGVTAAYVYSNRRGLGTTDVIVLTEGGLPDAQLIADAQAYIDSERPVQADALVFGPTVVPVNVTATIALEAGFSLADVAAEIEARLAVYFSSLKPGATAYLERIRAIISTTSGVLDFTVAAPLANVVALVDATHTQLAVLGVCTWS